MSSEELRLKSLELAFKYHDKYDTIDNLADPEQIVRTAREFS